MFIRLKQKPNEDIISYAEAIQQARSDDISHKRFARTDRIE